MKTIHHITRHQTWEEAQIIGSYRADSLLTEGFIHCSTPAQVLKTADRFFKGQTGLIILYINVEKVESEIKYELAENELFPHIYGALNLDAVYQTIDFENRDKHFMEKNLDMKVFVEQMAFLVDLRLHDEYKDGVVANFERICNIAKVVNEFELPEDVEAAPVFEP